MEIRETRSSNKGTSVTKCDLVVQLEGVTLPDLINGQEEWEVDHIVANKFICVKLHYLVCCKAGTALQFGCR